MVVAISPFERPDARLCLALARAGALAVLDLGRDEELARAALARMARESSLAFGVRIPDRTAYKPGDLPQNAEVVIIPGGASREVMPAAVRAWRPRVVLVRVTSIEEARDAADAGADGLILKGSESGGRVGDETAFVLLQHVIVDCDLPVWVQGGIGLHTAPACIAGGATGVVIDSQLALVRESALPEAIKAAIRTMDGSETVVAGGHRLFTRPDLPIARLAGSIERDAVIERLGANDLERSFVPAGQDAAFARPLAERFGTAGGVVHGIRDAIDSHLRDARKLEPLGPDSPLAMEHGIRYPIVQGPMTRVSDTAAFADAVSRAGGLPFLALALMKGEEVRALLEETRALLGDRAWGVGILGFVPENVREEQLAVIRDFKPPAAIIAGGRPSQARPLDLQGTRTFLHVPSPGLLDLFLKDGSRRFVFEGRECGGHVGPRTSFVLWEMQIERLLAFDGATEGTASGARKTPSRPPAAGPLNEVRVLFAGGVHDARSAAMVAAMAAPLAARGAKIGVLMGTAYLFTEEAVASGAIQPGFQRAAVECKNTVLLETAPGHATRCVDTPYVKAFREEKKKLEAEGKGPEEVWASLEQLNLGRLRIASKGLRRENKELAHVGAEAQAAEGMFMIGEVAALRGATLRMADLHRDVSAGATAMLARTMIEEVAPAKPTPADVAVIGIACIFPNAPDRHAFWANILANKNAVTEVPLERWSTETYYDAASQNGEKSKSKWGGFLPRVPFDPLAYGIPPRSISAIEPVQLLSLEVAKRALDDAGYATRGFNRERTSVIFGAEAGTDLSSAYGFRAMYPQYAGPIPPRLDEHLPVLTEDSFPGVLANVIAGRIANRLDLGGVNYTVDAACAASLAAVELSVKELTTGTSDMVLCGGADLHNSINDYLLFSSVHALSPTGACKTFDASADGIVLGEGVACVVLKRLADAERDGDRIYAVIKGIAGSSDGRSLGLTAPRKEGQIRALERAYRHSNLSPADVGLVEAHGTGTVVGDRTELQTLSEVFSRAGAKVGSAVLGSVKSQIGHTKCAAGIAGVIKVALALHHKVLPPTHHIQRFNPSYEPETSPFTFTAVAKPWASDERRGAVSAFGFGGTNFHAVLAAYDGADPPASGIEQWPAELFIFRAADRNAVLRKLERLEELASDPVLTLADLARSVSTRRRKGDGPALLAIVATSKEDLKDKIRRARSFTADPRGIFVPRNDLDRGKVAFVFSGQGSQRVGMLSELFVAFPSLQRHLANNPKIAQKMFPPLVTTDEARGAQAAAITDTRVAQPALGIAALALSDLMTSLGVRAELAAGHSYGELAALAYAGAIGERDLIALSEARGECILGATGDDPGTMAAVSATPESLTAHLAGLDRVVVANHNAPDQTVVSGPTAAIKEAIARLDAARIPARSIPVACAFHSPLVTGAKETFGARLAAVELGAPRIPVFSNATATPYPSDAAAIKAKLAEHVTLPVRFVAGIEAMYAEGARTFIEIGPGRVLTGLVGKILGPASGSARSHLAVACDPSGENSLKSLLIALADLAVNGVAIDVSALFAGRDAKNLDIEETTVTQAPSSLWLVDGHFARPATGEIPKGALRPVTELLVEVVDATQRPALPTGDREAAVVEYLRTTREIIEAQRQVMLGFLGESAPSETQIPTYASVPPMPSFSPPGRKSLPPGSVVPSASRYSRPPSITPTSGSLAPRAAKLPAESRTWMRDIGDTAGARSPVPPPPSDAPAPAAAPVDMKEALLAIVSERTGYPIDMLDLDLNLEAELSIDSIKRIEILGTLGRQLGFLALSGEGRDKAIEQLARLKTLRAILEWLEAREKANGAATTPAAAPAPDEGSAPETKPAHELNGTVAHSSVRPRELRRYVLDFTDAPLAGGTSTLAGKTFLLIPDAGGVAAAVTGWLVARGASVTEVAVSENLDGLIDLSMLSPDRADAKELFGRARAAIAAGAKTLIAASPSGSPFTAAGLLKSIGKELPELDVRAIALDPAEPATRLAEQVGAELLGRDGHVEVAYARGARRVPVARMAETQRSTSRVRLGRDAVVLVTGGARGITAQIAVALAKRFGCRLELVGRTPLPHDDEDAELAGAKDILAVRKVLIGQSKREANGATQPALIEARALKVMAAREIRATLAGITAAGGSFGYHAIDVRDRAAFGALLDDIYARHGRLDGIVHGAGVIEDKLFLEKTRDSFDRVFDTKVAGALTIAQKVRRDTSFIAFFASVSGAFGNRGQVDYAAANDTLDKIAAWLAPNVNGRVVSIDWGPWAGGGMVAPELEREYEKHGVGLIEPSAGVDAFLDELLHGGTETQVVLMSAEPSAFGAAASPVAPPEMASNA